MRIDNEVLDPRLNWLGWEELPDAKEGHTGKYPKYQNFLHSLVKEINPKNILEVGFNAGHSACCLLNAAPKANFVTFDICRWGTEEPAFEVLKKYFKIMLVKGDSKDTLPIWFEKYGDIKFDFIFIDGNHFGDGPYHDLLNTHNKLSNEGLLVIDDYHIRSIQTAESKINWDNCERIRITVPIEKSICIYKRIK